MRVESTLWRRRVWRDARARRSMIAGEAVERPRMWCCECNLLLKLHRCDLLRDDRLSHRRQVRYCR